MFRGDDKFKRTAISIHSSSRIILNIYVDISNYEIFLDVDGFLFSKASTLWKNEWVFISILIYKTTIPPAIDRLRG